MVTRRLWIIAASLPIHRGVYAYLASSTEFLVYNRRCLAGSVLTAGGRSVCSRRTSIPNGCSLGSLCSRGSSSGCSTDAVEKDWICCVFTRPPCDNSAHHTTSKCSDNDTVQKLVCDQNLLLARFQVQDLFSPCCGRLRLQRYGK